MKQCLRHLFEVFISAAKVISFAQALLYIENQVHNKININIVNNLSNIIINHFISIFMYMLLILDKKGYSYLVEMCVTDRIRPGGPYKV